MTVIPKWRCRIEGCDILQEHGHTIIKAFSRPGQEPPRIPMPDLLPGESWIENAARHKGRLYIRNLNVEDQAAILDMLHDVAVEEHVRERE